MKNFPKIEIEERRNLLMPMNINFLRQSKGMFLLKLEGWETSWGIETYLNICKKEDICIYDLFSDNLEEQILFIKEKVT